MGELCETGVEISVDEVRGGAAEILQEILGGFPAPDRLAREDRNPRQEIVAVQRGELFVEALGPVLVLALPP